MNWRELKQSGFTLVELIVVIAIIGILTSFAAPSFMRTIEAQHIKAAAETVLLDLRWARSESIKRNTNVSVVYTNGAAGAWQYSISPATKTVISASHSDFDEVALSQDFSSNTLVFDQVRGMTNMEPNTSRTVTLTSPNYTVKAVISLLGHVRMCGDVSGYTAC